MPMLGMENLTYAASQRKLLLIEIRELTAAIHALEEYGKLTGAPNPGKSPVCPLRVAGIRRNKRARSNLHAT